MTKTNSMVIQYPFDLKFTRIIRRRAKTRIRYKIPKIPNSWFQLAGMKNRT